VRFPPRHCTSMCFARRDHVQLALLVRFSCCGFKMELIERRGKECLDAHMMGGIVLVILFLHVYQS
jgi:hypothetical protein